MNISVLALFPYRKNRYLLPILGIICMVGLGGLILFYSDLPENEVRYSKGIFTKDMSATGLSFVEYEGNRKAFSLRIENFEVCRKKIGFFRLGFFKVARMQGVEINFHLDTKEEKTIKNSLDIEKYLLRNDKTKLLKLHNIKGMEIKDIEVNFFSDDKLVSSVKSNNASIGFKENDIIFHGKVTMFTGKERYLQCNKIRWVNESKRFTTNDDYLLFKGDAVFEGKGIECDYLLQDIQFDSPVKERRNVANSKKQP